MDKSLTVLAECVDIRNGNRFSKGDVFKPIPDVDQAKRLIAARCLPPAALDVAEQASAADDRNQLREDGPTVAEYVAAGYLASNYPPEGYASRSTDEEIAEAVAAEAAKAELEKLTNKQLQELAKQEDIAVEGDDNKATLVSKILAGRAAKA